MHVLKSLLIAILVISAGVFIIFFGRLPALRNTPIGSLNRLLVVRIPRAILKLDNAVTGGRLSTGLARFGNYLVNDRHPTILIFFSILLLVSEYMYLPAAWADMGMTNRFLGPMASILPYIFLYLAAFTDPGYITAENHVYHMGQYPYDYSAFHPGKFCPTCRLLKPARSKHCNVCKKCVAKMDHHCIFINKCVGQKNHRYFVMLLFTTGLLASYGGMLGFSILKDKILLRYPLWSPWKPAGMSWRDYFLVWSWGLERNTRVGAVSLLALLCSPMVWAFLFYTMFLIYCGSTTNESLKWGDWRAEIKDGFAFRRSMSLTREKYLSVEPAITRWPTDTEQILVRTADGTLPGSQYPGTGEWERVHSLREVDNLYDLGFADNLRDVFFHNYQFRDMDRERELRERKNGLPPFNNNNQSHRQKRRAKAAAL
ncbi:uncharacterized protein BROUX77_006406 [Berkeleyomyces rouxiae]|uniref:uncharacterized protein n=1 Tax=Berkeleyomyces rouxiae TaxID=2035830 RepID=UPI003B7BB60E